MHNRLIFADEKSFMGTVKDAQKRYALGMQTIKKVSKECGAEIRIGRSVRYNFKILDEYFLNQRSLTHNK